MIGGIVGLDAVQFMAPRKEKKISRDRRRSIEGRFGAEARLSMEVLEHRCLLSGVPRMVFDVQAPLPQDSGEPKDFTSVGSLSYFTAIGTSQGRELWVTDRTTGQTQLVKDIWPGPTTSNPNSLLNVDGKLYFAARTELAATGGSNYQLWTSDGTEAGTRRVTTTRLLGWDSYDRGFAHVDGAILYWVDAEGAFQLWRTDGTANGTYMLLSQSTTTCCFERFITRVGQTVYFTFFHEAYGEELWKTDGTPGGTRMVADLRAGPEGSYVGQMTSIGGMVLFTANDGRGSGIWKIDDVSGEIVFLKQVDGYNPYTLGAAINETAFFLLGASAFHPEVWKSDGTPGGTRFVVRIGSVIPDPYAQLVPSEIVAGFKGKLFYVTSDGLRGKELWSVTPPAHDLNRDFDVDHDDLAVLTANYGKNSATAHEGDLNGDGRVTLDDLLLLKQAFGQSPTVTMVKDIRPGAESSDPSSFTTFNGTLYFTADDGVHGRELWSTDGTEAGTVLVKDVWPGSLGSLPQAFVVEDSVMYFVGRNARLELELWSTDGTLAGTQLRSSIWTKARWYGPGYLTVVGDSLFFSRAGDGKKELWKSDGTLAGTGLVSEYTSYGDFYSPTLFVGLEDTLYLLAPERYYGWTLWSSDGTNAGTKVVKRMTSSSTGRELTAFSGRVFFTRDNRLWTSDGTEEGTFELDLGHPVGLRAVSLTAFNGELYFSGRTGFTEYDWELWRSNGTQAGTVMVKNIYPSIDGSYPADFAALGGMMLFSANTIFGRELLSSDGTNAGTRLVKDINGSDSNPRNLVRLNNFVLFTATGSDGKRGLWRSDGTAGGTFLVRAFDDGGGGWVGGFVAAGAYVYFFSTGPMQQYYLWRSDGTAAGTIPLVTVDGRPFGGGRGQQIVQVDETVYFHKFNDATGWELWQTDGTPAGTTFVMDLAPPPRPGYPAEETYEPEKMVAYNGALYFVADDGVHSTTLWTVRPESRREAADVNDDGAVNRVDLAAILRQYGRRTGGLRLAEDLNGDRRVDLADIRALKEFYDSQSPASSPAVSPSGEFAVRSSELSRIRAVRRSVAHDLQTSESLFGSGELDGHRSRGRRETRVTPHAAAVDRLMGSN